MSQGAASSSWPVDQGAGGPIAALVERAVRVLEEECPVHSAGLSSVLSRVSVGIELDDESFSMTAPAGRTELVRGSARGDIGVRATGEAARALLEGRLSLIDAVREGRIRIFGAPRVLSEGSLALRWFLHGLVRARRGAGLLEEFKVLISRRVGRAK